MRIELKPSAKRHSITEDEIRAALAYPELRIVLAPRRTDIATAPVLHIARPADNEPHLEVIADLIDPTITTVFHAMMLRPVTVDSLGINALFTPDYGPQRPQL